MAALVDVQGIQMHERGMCARHEAFPLRNNLFATHIQLVFDLYGKSVVFCRDLSTNLLRVLRHRLLHKTGPEYGYTCVSFASKHLKAVTA